MNTIVKIIGIGLAGGILSVFLKQEKAEYALMTAIAASAVILYMTASQLLYIVQRFQTLISECGVDIKYFTVCIKTAGIAYVTQFGADILRDAGESAIAAKVEAAGKICILAVTIPILESLAELCLKAVSGI